MNFLDVVAMALEDTHTHTYIHKGSLRWSQKRQGRCLNWTTKGTKTWRETEKRQRGGDTERAKRERGGGGETDGEKRESGGRGTDTERERERQRERFTCAVSRAQWQHTLHLCTSLDIATFSRQICYAVCVNQQEHSNMENVERHTDT